jgi:hypothetical protein
MKKTIVLILLLIPMLCFAGALQEKHRSVIAKKNVVASGGYDYIGGVTSWPSTTGNTSMNGGNVTLETRTYTTLGVKMSSYVSATKCYVALYSSGGSTRLAYGECSPRTADEWCEASINYSATAGTHQLWFGCNSSVNMYYAESGCTGKYATYADPPVAENIEQGNNGGTCNAMRIGY